MKCKLENLQDSLLKTMITCGANNVGIREKPLQNDDLTLDKAIELCSFIQMSKTSCELMAKSTAVDAVMSFSKYVEQRSHNQGGSESTDAAECKNKMINSCEKCGRSHTINQCPAYGNVCTFWKLKNHSANECYQKKKKISEIDKKDSIHEIIKTDGNDTYFFIGYVEINTRSIKKSKWITDLSINKKNIEFKIDTGVDANVIPYSEWEKLGIPKDKLLKAEATLIS